MNKKVLEEIREKLREIEHLLDNQTGNYFLLEKFAPFKQRVEEELKNEVWERYNRERGYYG